MWVCVSLSFLSLSSVSEHCCKSLNSVSATTNRWNSRKTRWRLTNKRQNKYKPHPPTKKKVKKSLELQRHSSQTAVEFQSFSAEALGAKLLRRSSRGKAPWAVLRTGENLPSGYYPGVCICSYPPVFKLFKQPDLVHNPPFSTASQMTGPTTSGGFPSFMKTSGSLSGSREPGGGGVALENSKSRPRLGQTSRRSFLGRISSGRRWFNFPVSESVSVGSTGPDAAHQNCAAHGFWHSFNFWLPNWAELCCCCCWLECGRTI